MTTVLKLSFLLIFQALLLPVTTVDTSAIETADRYPTKAHKTIDVQVHTSASALASGVLLKEPTEAKHDIAVPNIYNIVLLLTIPPHEASPNSLDHPLAPVSFLTYLSLFSNSPPTLS